MTVVLSVTDGSDFDQAQGHFIMAPGRTLISIRYLELQRLELAALM
jgi:hypothetical protein